MYTEFIPEIFRKYIDLINISKIEIEDEIIKIQGEFKSNIVNSQLRGKKGSIYIGKFDVQKNHKVRRIVFLVNNQIISVIQFTTNTEISEFDVHFLEFKIVLSSLRHVDGLLNFLIE
jgi:hypothetical protein